VQRDDDKEETVKKRLDVYHNQTEVLLGYYNKWAQSGQPGAPKYRKIEGVGPVEQIRDSAFAALAK
jgi:adenylate kinase